MTWYCEWASNVKARKGRMLPLKALETICKYKDPGYSSVYMFSEEDAKILKDSESSVGMSRFSVGSDKLIIDIDTGEDGLYFVGSVLQKNGLGFRVYESGGKGYHIEIDHQFVYDKRLPYSHKQAVVNLVGSFGVDFVDLTLYQHGRLISLLGRIHPVTKKKKTFLKEFPGKSLNLDLVDEPPKMVPRFEVTNDYTKLGWALYRASELVRIEPEVGKRHVNIWSLAKNFQESGIDHSSALNIISKVNESWKNPKKSNEVEAAVSSAYQK